MASGRPAIPSALTRKILVESGHRCAVCGMPSPLEKAHIIPWRESKQHVADDLICLCANCHHRADTERWGQATLREYKLNPWVLRHSVGKGLDIQKSVVELTVSLEMEQFDDHQESMLRHAVAGFLRVEPGAVRIVEKEDD